MLASTKRFLKNPNTVLIEEASIVLSENALAAPEVLNGVLKNAAKDADLLAELGNAEKSIGKSIASNSELLKGVKKRLKPLGRGSAGRTNPKNLDERIAMIEAMSYSGSDIVLSDPKRTILADMKINDPRWHHSEGWVKASHYTNKIEVHYVLQHENGIIKAVDDFKFKS